MRDLKLILVTFALSLICGVLIGHITKVCVDCEKVDYIAPNKALERIDKQIEIEKVKIEKKTDEQIKEILTNPNTSVNDSIWRIYAKRFN